MNSTPAAAPFSAGRGEGGTGAAPRRYAAAALTSFARRLLQAAGVDDAIASDVATVLVDGDLLGHTTHGLQLLAPYLRELDAGTMAKSGTWETVNRRSAAELWDGRRLPGAWLVLRAIDRAGAMATQHGTGTVVIRRAHHVACLAAYLKRATDAGFMMLLSCSDPGTASVAPFNAITPVFTPNPIAAGIPTSGDPILLDISASLTTNGMTGRLHQEGRRLPHAWIQDHEGNPTDVPSVLFREPKGTLLPTGGIDAGHKGFGLALLIEALTAGLTGHGRADPHEGWGATVFVQLLAPDALGGLTDFARQMDWLAGACHDATPRPGVDRVRLPGEAGLRRYRTQQQDGVQLYAGVVATLEPWAERYRLELPPPL